jgi:hypothetical protein
MEEFDVLKHGEPNRLVDVCVCKMKEKHFTYPFLTHQVVFPDNTIVEAHQPKYFLQTALFSEPNTDKLYYVFGTVRTELVDDIRLDRVNTIKNGLRFVTRANDYLLFNSQHKILDVDDWSGLSGAPVFSSEGECVGVFCSVNMDSHMIFVVPIQKVKILIDMVDKKEN